jgi:NADH dehydrogenase [ubiquinone] 1 alpha subcomplex assembly factor 5
VSQDSPFDRSLRRRRRDRAAVHFGEADYLHRLAADELLERLDLVTRPFARALDIGCAGNYLAQRLRTRGLEVTSLDAGLRFAKAAGGAQGDEDRLPFADGAFDLVVSVGALDTVNDLPGALILARRALRPDGLFLGAFAGAGSLPRLRSAMLAADAAGGGASPRIHPQIDVRAAGDLLVRDLRAMGATNILGERSRKPIGRPGLAAALADFAAAAEADGRTRERFEIVHLSGWAPSPDQPKPARRGSATVSLAEALKPRSDEPL